MFLTLLSLGFAREARADLLLTGPKAPVTSLGLRSAAAVSGATTTRWSRLTFEGTTRAMWLVPAMPGAAIDWADGWLEELDAATTPRGEDCGTAAGKSFESFDRSGPIRRPTARTMPATEAKLRDHAALRGFEISTATGDQIHAAWERGFRFAVFEIESPDAALASTPTIRVRDDGGPFPLAPAVRDVDVRWTLFTLTPGAVTIEGAGEIDSVANYLAVRAQKLGASGWVRDASVPRPAAPECTCAAGDLGGASACTLACSDASLAGTTNLVINRFTGLAPRATPSAAPLFRPALPRSRMLLGEPCGVSPPAYSAPPPADPYYPPIAPVYRTTQTSGESCGSDPAYGEAASEGCALIASAAREGSSGDDDDNSTGSDSWGGDDSSDSSDSDDASDDANDASDDADDASDDADSDDDWDDADTESIPLNVKPKKLTRQSTSPVSRMALLLGALALPFRRRRRPAP